MYTLQHLQIGMDLIRPGSKWSLKGLEPNYSELDWRDENTTEKPTEQEFLQALADAENYFYRQQRAKEYPDIGDQLDALFHAGLFPEEMAAKIQAIKDKYPK